MLPPVRCPGAVVFSRSATRAARMRVNEVAIADFDNNFRIARHPGKILKAAANRIYEGRHFYRGDNAFE